MAGGVRHVATATYDDAQVTCVELDFMSAADLLPELTAVLAPGYTAASGDDATIGRAIAAMATQLAGGKLRAMLPSLLKGTTVIAPDETGKQQKHDLSNGADAINRAFTGRKKVALQVVKLALEVNFRDFLDGLDLSGLGTRTP